MRMGQIVLALSALIWGGFALKIFFDPATLAGMGVLTDGPVGRQEIRAFYGGVEAGIALFLVWSALDRARIRSGLMLGMLAIGGSGLGRVVGVVIEGFETIPMMWIFAAVELSGAVFTAWVMSRLPPTA